MLIGSIAAIAHGAGLPLLMLFFGNLINTFIYEAITATTIEELNINLTGLDIDCYTVLPAVNRSLQDIIDVTFNNSMARCILEDTFIAETNNIVYIFLGIAAAVWLAAYAQVGFFQAAAERQTHKIRLRYYKAILRQDIAWFDENPSGELANRISE